MQHTRLAVFAAASLLAVSPALGLPPERPRFDIAPGPLGRAVITLGEQGGVSIGFSDPALALLPVRGLYGRYTPGNALKRLLSGLPARAVGADDKTFRIVVASAGRQTSHTVRHATETKPVVAPVDAIVVTASKRDTSLASYPGDAIVLDGFALGAPDGGNGSETIIDRVPSLSSTQLGPGRNKLFVRGVADSSFNGPSQAVVGQYLGELRLNYNAPDPNLSLYDTQRIELLEGPQGTLYGAGSLAGVVRILPNPVRYGALEAAAAVGVATTAHGAMSNDVAAMVNFPLADHIALRAVAYDRSDGGYIDDVGRHLGNVNHGNTFGGRAALDVERGAWTIEATGLIQYIYSADGQYTERGLPALAHSSAIAQPFDNDYALGGISARRSWQNSLVFVTSTSVVRQDVHSRYDFTESGGSPRAFDQRNAISLVTNETRLSRSNLGGVGWLIGSALLSDSERIGRNLGGMSISGVRNDVYEAAAFGETTVRPLPHLYLTVGARLSYDHLSGQPVDAAPDLDTTHIVDGDRNQARVLPSLSLSWRPKSRLQLFARYEEGFRPGGLSISNVGGVRQVQRFRGDTIGTLEGGGRLTGQRWEASVSLATSFWKAIQADLVDADGLPYTANIGNGTIQTAEARISWRPSPPWSFDLALVASDSDLSQPAPAFVQAGDAELPNIPGISARAGVAWHRQVGNALDLGVSGWMRYVGASRLGVGSMLDIRQGAYVDDALTLRLGRGRFGISLEMSNLADAKGNRFALGDPFTVSRGLQETPLPPRTIRLGVDGRF